MNRNIELKLKEALKDKFSESEWNMWFRDISVIDISNNEINMSIPSAFIKESIVETYSSSIEDIIEEMLGRKYNITFEIVKKNYVEPKEELKPKKINTDKFNKKIEKKEIKKKILFNEKYTFDSFILGENNDFAANAAMAIAKNPGTAYNYNPLLLYGGVGLGKTHLIQAIGSEIQKNDPDKKIIYVNAEEFINEFIEAIPKKTISNFKLKYRSADILLIDDIHFFQGKDSTQEELFHTFNSLYEYDKQIVFTCDRPISELRNLTDRLRSRFSRGMNIDLKPPKFETRVSILRQKLNFLKQNKSSHIKISDEIINFLAKTVATNIRDLESSLMTLAGYSELTKKEITIEIAKEKLQDYIENFEDKNISSKEITEYVAKHYNIPLLDLLSKKRQKSITITRQISMYIIRNITEQSTSEIGKYFNRDHSTVIHGIDKIEKLISVDESLGQDIDKLIKNLTTNNAKL